VHRLLRIRVTDTADVHSGSHWIGEQSALRETAAVGSSGRSTRRQLRSSPLRRLSYRCLKWNHAWAEPTAASPRRSD